MENITIGTGPKSIKTLWNINSDFQDLKSSYRVHFWWRLSLYNKLLQTSEVENKHLNIEKCH